MSGIEAAGLALGIVPIILYGIEQLQDIRAEKSRKEFFTNLLFEITFLQMNLKMLASSLSDIPSNVREKLLSPDKPEDVLEGWQEQSVVDAMKARLDPGYQAFLTTLTMILELFSSLLDSSAVHLTTEDVINTDSAYEKLRGIHKAYYKHDLKNRIKFTLYDKRKTNRTLTKITECNEKLDKIVTRTIDTSEQPEGNSAQLPEDHPHFKLRPLMHPLYETLGGLWPCNPCECGRVHEARLCMLKRKYKSNLPNSSVWFDLYMSLRTNAGEQYCRWLESKLCIALEQESETQTPRDSGVRFVMPNELTPPQSPSGSPEGLVMPDRSNTSISGTTLVSGRRRSSTGFRKRIQNLCKTLYEANRHSCVPSLLFDEGAIWHISGTMECQNSQLQGHLIETSLATLLGGKRRFSKKEKMILSVILAHSLLDFCESPWLDKDWDKEHVIFLSQSNGELPELHRPYLTAAFRHPNGTEDGEGVEDYRIHQNASVLALGILLLEIELDSAIEDHRTNVDLDAEGQKTVNTDHFTAFRALEEKGDDDIWANTRRAIESCLTLDFFDPDTMEPNLDNLEFRQAIYMHIVLPLELDLKNGFELTPDILGL